VAIGFFCSAALFLLLRKRSRQPRSLRTTWLRFALCIGVGFLIAELCVRLAMTLISTDGTQPTAFDPELGWSRPPANRIAPNSHGGSASEDPDVVVVGDSVAYGHGVAPEHGMVHQTRLQLEPRGWSLLNAAVSGYGIDQTTLYVKRHLPAWKNLKVLVFVGFAGNDLEDTASNIRYGHDKPLFRSTNGKLWESQGALSRFSRRNLLSTSRLIFSFEALHPSFSSLVDRFAGKVTLGKQETHAVTLALLNDLLNATEQRDVETLLVLVPARMDLTSPTPPYRWLEQAFESTGSPTISLLRPLQRQKVDSGSFFLPGDPWHLSAAGHRIAADLITEAILNLQPPQSIHDGTVRVAMVPAGEMSFSGSSRCRIGHHHQGGES
jgi:lysophospholipase L1-like esterase